MIPVRAIRADGDAQGSAGRGGLRPDGDLLQVRLREDNGRQHRPPVFARGL